ncbi:hypothetical protein [Streptomyces buecherae]|uniref:Extracellular solute-binding protein n=1 Tax=Streptomyces buecherae TaxID=2763006 RepID=A0A7H8NFL6_9ACTN|nr:hypothetical protein [Streptomyces buecherae]QKW53231.1 hypothetical protein HUT08_30955 [Streptomyces buecherae]
MGHYRGRQVHALNYAYTVYGVRYSSAPLSRNDWAYPKTWDDMLALCAAARRKGVAGWTYAGKYPYYPAFSLLPFIGRIGGARVLRDLDNLEAEAWRHPAVTAAFEAYVELGAKG